MRIHLVIPGWGPFPLAYRSRVPMLNLVTIAAYIPEEHSLRLLDDRLEPIGRVTDVPDLVLLSAMTVQIQRAYRIADLYRRAGAYVALGGIHPSLNTEEALEHADTILVGEGEQTIGEFIRDLEAKQAKKIYIYGKRFDFAGYRPPRRDLFAGIGYLAFDPIQTSRGCPCNCDFCIVPHLQGRAFRRKPLDLLAREMDGLAPIVFLTDDNVMLDVGYFRRVMGLLAERRCMWSALANSDMLRSGKLVQEMKDAGCWLLYLDIGPRLNQEIARNKHAYRQQLKDLTAHIRAMDIKVIASFVFGYDFDTPDVFEQTVRFALQAGFDEAEFHMVTPFPKTRLRKRLKEQGRLLAEDWRHFSCDKAIFVPKQMTPGALEQGLRYAWREFYQAKGIDIFGGQDVLVSFPNIEGLNIKRYF